MSLRSGTGGPGSDLSLDQLFYPLFERVFDEDSDLVASVESALAKARMADNAELFVSRALGIGTLVGLLLWLLGLFVGYLVVTFLLPESPVFIGIHLPPDIRPYVNALKIPFVIVVTGVVFGAIGFGLGFGSFLALPYVRSSSRKREINILLSDSVSFMYALSVGGLNQLEILHAMAQADDTYGEVAQEFQSIVLATEYFDIDYRTAIRQQAERTPSNELSKFLTDMLSIINSGGDMTAFLEDQKNKQLRTARREQEKMLDTLELFGEMYMTLSLFPLLLIIILVIMGLMQSPRTTLLYATVYGLIPMVGVGFIVLVSTVTQDEIGDGFLHTDRGTDRGSTDDGVAPEDAIDEPEGGYGVFDRIRKRELRYRLLQFLRQPHVFFRSNPLYVLVVTVPITLALLAGAVVSGVAPLSIDAMSADPIRGTFVWLYVPLYLNCLPLAVFYEWNVIRRRSIVSNLSDDLRKLASANDTGMTLLESIHLVSRTSGGRLSQEFENIYAKVNYGTGLKQSLIEFNNKYHLPRLARTVKLISEAQEASSQIHPVLSTAAQTSENQDEIERERKARTRMQVAIIVMTYLTLLGVMALLQVQFIDVIAGLTEQASSASGGGAVGGGGAASFGQGADPQLLEMLFFHAVSLQAIISSFIAGYIREVKLLAGMKFAVVLSTVALVAWIFVSSGG